MKTFLSIEKLDLLVQSVFLSLPLVWLVEDNSHESNVDSENIQDC